MRQQINWGCRFVLQISGGAIAMTDPRNRGYKSSTTTKSSKSDEEGGTHTSFGFESAKQRSSVDEAADRLGMLIRR